MFEKSVLFTFGTAAVMTWATFWVLKFRPSAALYHALLFFTFFVAYSTMPGGFKKHFYVPEKTNVDALDIGYYTAITHSGVGYGDMYPISTPARLLVGSHVLLVVLAIFNILPFDILTSG